MSKNRKAIVLYRLTLITFLISILFKRGKLTDVYFFEVSLYFQKRIKLIERLEQHGYRWIKKDYIHFSDFEKGNIFATDFQRKIFEKINLSFIVNLINQYYSSEKIKTKMEVVWRHNIFKAIKPFAFQYAVFYFLDKKNIYTKVRLLTSNSIALLIKDHLQPNVKIILFPFIILSDYYDTQYIYNKLIRFLLNKITSLLRFNKKNKLIDANSSLSPYYQTLDSAKAYEVAYFPHQGIFFGNLFVKDQFYSSDSKSSLHSSRILHISLNEKTKDYMEECYEYYGSNKIPHIDSSDFGISLFNVIKDYLLLLSKTPFKILSEVYRYGAVFIILVSIIFIKIKLYYSIVSKLKKLKLALAGYDYLFAPELAIALQLIDVKVCATQERFIQAFYASTYYLFDYYFIAGPIVKEKGLKNSNIDNCVSIGLPRVDRLYEFDKLKISDDKYDVIKKSKKLVLVFDYPLPENDYQNTSLFLPKVDQMRRFYEDLLQLSIEFPQIHIVIKGKDIKSYSSVYISDIVQKIDSAANINIELNLDKYNPHFIAAKADLTIACHTSICDELLASDRDVIFYEISDYMETHFNYDNVPVIVKEYSELKHHVNNYLSGNMLKEVNRKILKEEFYSNCYHGNVCNKVQSILENMLDK
ncbi:MAG: hypothetical protein NT010_16195 [Proteobacteria bacterium]|nr:hypothetical protein [Pseudomonadota bacterium]